MRKIKFQAKSKTLSHKDLWKITTTLEKYPQWCKFCKSIVATEVKEGATYHDITTLLWIPLKIKHVITKVKPYEELHLFLPLPGGGKLWYKVFFQTTWQRIIYDD